MPEYAVGPRVLLKRLREIMAEALEPQARLDRIVSEIARNMVAEVCSLYVLRADGVLELYATEGLNPQAVHLAQLRLGQGLVGTIAASARPLNLADAQTHPAFTYLPETGEEIYSSFLGVPVLRAGQTLGVLVVQNSDSRIYGEDETEAMLTTATTVGNVIQVHSSFLKPNLSTVSWRRRPALPRSVRSGVPRASTRMRRPFGPSTRKSSGYPSTLG